MVETVTANCNYVQSDVEPYLFAFQNSIPSEQEISDCKNKQEPEQINVQIKTKAMEYKGTTKKESDFDQVLIGVFDKKKSQLNLVKGTSIVPLVQKVSNLNIVVKDSQEDHRARRKMLIHTFGNKKSKQIQKTYEIGTITMNNIVGAEQLQGILEQKSSNTEVPDFKPVKRGKNSGGKNKRR